jgi:uncharacterized protein YigA (DUF484 family)
MELLMNSKTDYLLEASLESLHAESTEWLSEIDFWSDEMTFFYRLLRKNQSNKAFPTAELAAVEMELVSLTSDKVNKLRNDIQSHERALSAVMRNTSSGEEEGYREKHRQLVMDIYETHNLIRAFKKEVFSFVQKYD